VLAIARRYLELIQQRDGVRLRSIEWHAQPELAAHLAERGYDARYGARPLKRVIERELLVPLAEALNQYQAETTLSVDVGVANGSVRIRVKARTDEQERVHTEAIATLADNILTQRRRISRLEHCTATERIDDEISMLESLERRLKKTNFRTPQLQARLAKLPKLRECVQAVRKLNERMRDLETEALGMLYSREALDSALISPELAALHSEMQKLMRVVFRMQQEQPDDVVLAFYSENGELLREFAKTYYDIGDEIGEVVALDYFLPPPTGRSSATKLVRETPKKLETFFTTPPEKLIGVMMHLRGDLFFPRFQPEAGLHVMKEKKKDRVCLIEAVQPPFEAYEPPAGIERQGAIAARGASVCRTYEREKNAVQDRVLGEKPWISLGVGRCVIELTEQRLEKMIEEATR
jgi:hypothetical protein